MTNDKQRERLVELLVDSEIDYAQYLSEACNKAINGDVTVQLMKRMEFYADRLLANGVIVPPCKVGDKFYKVERWCTEGGYREKPSYAYSSTCEDCCEECDGEDNIIEYTFHSPQQILSLERVFGKYVFLTKEEAEKALKGSEM